MDGRTLMEKALLMEESETSVHDRSITKLDANVSGKLRTDPPLLNDKALRSVVDMMVRPNEGNQSHEGGKAVRHWYEQMLHQERIITKAHQMDVLRLLTIIVRMSDQHGLTLPKEVEEMKQFHLPSV
jgi:hypothetical protein